MQAKPLFLQAHALGDPIRFARRRVAWLHSLATALQGAVDGLIADQRMQQIFSKGNVAWRAA